MKKSVMSAVGSMEISGASRWLAACEDAGAVPNNSAIVVRLTTSTLSNLRIRNSFFKDKTVTLQIASKYGYVMSGFDSRLHCLPPRYPWIHNVIYIHTQTGVVCFFKTNMG